MKTATDLCATIDGLTRDELERCLAQGWVRPGADGLFQEIDVARLRLIQELRTDMGVNDEAMPVILSLVDQVHDLRRLVDRLARDLETAQGGRAPKQSPRPSPRIKH